MSKHEHEEFMRQAMELALKAQGLTSPNPLVGALLVKEGKVIARGFHHKAGLAHAEVLVLGQAQKRSRGATLYVTLEPCCHFGRTPPCTEKIINSGIRKIIVGMRDPNPINNGKGINILRRKGIDVKVGFLEKELRRVNEFYIKYITTKIPFVVVKAAQSLDGKISTHTKDSKWITSRVSREFSKRLRNNFDAILVGINTLLSDEPGLDPKRPKGKFYKVIVDSKLQTHIDAKILLNQPERVIIATTKLANEDKIRYLSRKQAKILVLPDKEGRVNLRALMQRLAKFEITSILVEGGGSLIGSLFDERLIDKAMFFIAPKVIGGKDALTSVEGEGTKLVKDAIRLEDIQIQRIGKDFLVEGYPRY